MQNCFWKIWNSRIFKMQVIYVYIQVYIDVLLGHVFKKLYVLNLCALMFTWIEIITKYFQGTGHGFHMFKLFSIKRSQEVSDFRNSKISYFFGKKSGSCNKCIRKGSIRCYNILGCSFKYLKYYWNIIHKRKGAYPYL